MPKRLLTTHRAILWSLTAIALYLLGYYLFGPDPVRIVFGSMLIGSLTTASIILTGPAVKALGRGLADGGDNILVSQWGVFSLLFFYFCWVQFNTWWRIDGRDPDFLRDLPIGGLFTTLFFIVTAYTILAPINTHVEIERPSLYKWFLAVSIGSAIAAVLATLSFMGVVNYFSGRII